jgi:transposase
MFGMEGFRVLAVDNHHGELHVLVELERQEAPCPSCGTFSSSVKQRPAVRLADAPSGGRRVTVFWRKRRLRCAEGFCPQASFTQQAPEHVAGRARLTERLRALVATAVRTRSVAEVAAEHGLSWASAWRAAKARIEAELASKPPPAPVRLGLDETTFRRPQRFATGFVDLDTGHLVDLVEGRSKALVAQWLAGLEPSVRAGIAEVALDPFAGYNAAVRDGVPQPRVTIDKFHALRLANQVVTEVRCRRQQELTGHRGRTGDALYGARRDLLRRAEGLSQRGRERLGAAFAADDELEVECAWVAKESFAAIYDAPDRASAHRRLVAWYQLAVDYDVGELTRFATTISTWESQFLNYFDSRATNAASEGRNLIIKQVKRGGFGFRKFEHYRLRVLYRCR